MSIRILFSCFLVGISLTQNLFSDDEVKVQDKDGICPKNYFEKGVIKNKTGNLIEFSSHRLLVYSSPNFNTDPDFVLSPVWGLVPAKEFPRKDYFSFVATDFEKYNQQFVAWNRDKTSTARYFPLVSNPDLPIILSYLSNDRGCFFPYVKFEELVLGGFRILINNKNYYVKDITRRGPPHFIPYYLDEAIEESYLDKYLRNDSSFVAFFEQLKKIISTKDEMALKGLMLPTAELELKKVYKINKVKEGYIDFIWKHSFSYSTTHKQGLENSFSIHFPLVTFRPFSRGQNITNDPIVYIRIRGSETVQDYGEEVMIVKKQKSQWKIENILLNVSLCTEIENSEVPKFRDQDKNYSSRCHLWEPSK